MWPSVEEKFATLLSSKIYPALRGVAAYDGLLTAGKPDAAKCKAFANQVMTKTDLQSGIREKGITGVPQVEEWSKPLFRAITPGKNNPNGAWWFDTELLDRWLRNIPAGTPDRKQKVMESIRPMLAVSFNWNDFTELQVMNPPSPIPVITGQGTHKPIFSPDPRDKAAQQKYEENKNVFFIGGYKQVFVPIVNPATTKLHVF